MITKDIIKMAYACDLNRVCGPLETLLDDEWESLHRFALLIAAAEREACILRAVELGFISRAYVEDFAAAIRART